MKSLFSYESPVAQVLFKFCCACSLNLLWLICSLPIVTVGASTTALYSVTIKLIRDAESTSIVRQFFDSFRANFKQATQLWLLLLGVGVFLGLDAYTLFHLRQTTTGAPAILWTVFFAVILAAILLYSIVMAYIFPMLAYFNNSNRAMLLNSFLVGIHYLFCTIVVLAIHVAMFYVIVNLFTPLLLFAEGLCALASSYFLSTVFYAVSGEKKRSLDEEDAEWLEKVSQDEGEP